MSNVQDVRDRLNEGDIASAHDALSELEDSMEALRRGVQNAFRQFDGKALKLLIAIRDDLEELIYRPDDEDDEA